MATSLSAVVVWARSAVRRAIQNVARARVRVATAVIGCQSRCRLVVMLEATAPAAAPAAIPPNTIPPNAITPTVIAPNTAAADRARERVWFIVVGSYALGDGKAETITFVAERGDAIMLRTISPRRVSGKRSCPTLLSGCSRVGDGPPSPPRSGVLRALSGLLRFWDLSFPILLGLLASRAPVRAVL